MKNVRRFLKYSPLLISITLLNLVTIIEMGHNDSLYFYGKQADEVTQRENMHIYTIDHADRVIQSIYQYQAQLQSEGVSFLVKYHQNIPNNPLNQVYLFWEGDHPIQFPMLFETGVQQQDSLLVGKRAFQRLELKNKQLLTINQKPLHIQGVMGVKGVIRSFFDESVIVPGHIIDEAYVSRIPQNRTAVVYILTEDIAVSERMIGLLDMEIKDMVSSTSFDNGFTSAKNVMPDNKFLAYLFPKLFGRYVISVITLIMIIKFVTQRDEYGLLVQKMLGATTRVLFKEVLGTMILFSGFSGSLTLLLYLVSLYFDLPFLPKIRPMGYYILIGQTLIFPILYLFLVGKQIITTKLATLLGKGV